MASWSLAAIRFPSRASSLSSPKAARLAFEKARGLQKLLLGCTHMLEAHAVIGRDSCSCLWDAGDVGRECDWGARCAERAGGWRRFENGQGGEICLQRMLVIVLQNVDAPQPLA